MSKADKILLYIIAKIESRLSRKENKLGKKEGISNRLSMYRDILDTADKYNEAVVLRHYKYISLHIDDIDR